MDANTHTGHNPAGQHHRFKKPRACCYRCTCDAILKRLHEGQTSQHHHDSRRHDLPRREIQPGFQGQTVGQCGWNGGHNPAVDVLEKHGQALLIQPVRTTHDDHRRNERGSSHQQATTQHHGHRSGHERPAEQRHAPPVARWGGGKFVEDLFRHVRWGGTRLNGSDKTVHFREFGKVHAQPADHAENAYRDFLGGTNMRENGDGVQGDVHVAVVQAVGRCHRMNLCLHVVVAGAGGEKNVADACGNVHYARYLRGISQVDGGQWGGWGSGFRGVDSRNTSPAAKQCPDPINNCAHALQSSRRRAAKRYQGLQHTQHPSPAHHSHT